MVFPQTEIGNDPADIRRYAQAVERAGYTHLVAYDHVLGANPDRPSAWAGPYTHRTPFHEVFVLLSFVAGITQRLELATGVLILPQRQTALVAKQAAALDVLSGGRVRLGVGLGWNAVEYEALGEDFSTRGRRIEEQIALMRRLWSKELVTFEGRWHRVSDAGLNPLPTERSIPLWMGGSADAAMQRISRIADGWMINIPLGEQLGARLAQMRGLLAQAGRDVAAFGLEGRVQWREGAEQVARDLDAWQEHGATHVSINTMSAGLPRADAHVEALESVARLRFR